MDGTENNTCQYRVLGSEERALIVDSWAGSARRSPRYQHVAGGHWAAVVDGFRRLLAEGCCVVAADQTVWGWACGAKGADGLLRVHYVYVLSAFRRSGLACQLVSHLGATLDAQTPGWYDLRMPPYTRGIEDHGWRLTGREWRRAK